MKVYTLVLCTYGNRNWSYKYHLGDGDFSLSFSSLMSFISFVGEALDGLLGMPEIETSWFSLASEILCDGNFSLLVSADE